MTDRDRLIHLNLVGDIGPLRVCKLLEVFGSLEQLFRARIDEVKQVAGFNSVLAERIITGIRDERRLEQELTLVRKAGVSLITKIDSCYPVLLQQIPDPPLVLYVRGTLPPTDLLSLGVVGSRRASAYGLQCARQLGYDLSLQGVSIISGLARGIDAAAHEGALKADGFTVGVLGSGLSRLYPPEHEALAERIATNGAVLSEYPLTMGPLAKHFPRRNRIISGLSHATLVVEAASRSGALITADCALEQGREVFAIPGQITDMTSRGTHNLLKQGARLATRAEDILEVLGSLVYPLGVCTVARDKLDPDAAETVLPKGIEEQPKHVEDIAVQNGMGVTDALQQLLELELSGLVEQLPGKRFIASHAVNDKR